MSPPDAGTDRGAREPAPTVLPYARARSPSWPKRLADWLLHCATRPPPTWYVIALLPITVVLAFDSSGPVQIRRLWQLLAWPGAAFFLALLTLIRGVGCAWAGCLRATEWRWYAIATLLALCTSMMFSDWPFRLRFAIGRSALEAEARALLAGPPTTPPDWDPETYGVTWPVMLRPVERWIGTFRVDVVAVFPAERVVYFYTGGGFRIGWGIVYDPVGQPLHTRVHQFEPAWSIFVDDRW